MMYDQFQMFKNKYLTDIFKRYKDSYLVLNILDIGPHFCNLSIRKCLQGDGRSNREIQTTKPHEAINFDDFFYRVDDLPIDSRTWKQLLKSRRSRLLSCTSILLHLIARNTDVIVSDRTGMPNQHQIFRYQALPLFCTWSTRPPESPKASTKVIEEARSTIQSQ